MSVAKVRVNAPLYFGAGQKLNGQNLLAATWVREGVIEMDYERAVADARNGYVSIVEVDGESRAVGCCTSS